jgi:CheY-like chemotaxis protein
VLVVDDNDTCRKVLVQQCSAWGMNVSAVPSGKEALALLRTKAHLRDYFDGAAGPEHARHDGMLAAARSRKTQA